MSKYGFSQEALAELARALQAGRLRSAYFNHPELGGVGLWERGNVIIGNMNDEDLRARIWRAVDDMLPQLESKPNRRVGKDNTLAFPWWGDIHLGEPNCSGIYENITYGYFLRGHRAIVQVGDTLTHYDLTGVGVQDMTITFNQRGSPVVTVITLAGPRPVSAFPVIKP